MEIEIKSLLKYDVRALLEEKDNLEKELNILCDEFYKQNQWDDRRRIRLDEIIQRIKELKNIFTDIINFK
jgi:hypothetical protein